MRTEAAGGSRRGSAAQIKGGDAVSRAEEFGGSSRRGGERRGESAFGLGVEGAWDKVSLRGTRGRRRSCGQWGRKPGPVATSRRARSEATMRWPFRCPRWASGQNRPRAGNNPQWWAALLQAGWPT
jgi:hypothetical protein